MSIPSGTSSKSALSRASTQRHRDGPHHAVLQLPRGNRAFPVFLLMHPALYGATSNLQRRKFGRFGAVGMPITDHLVIGVGSSRNHTTPADRRRWVRAGGGPAARALPREHFPVQAGGAGGGPRILEFSKFFSRQLVPPQTESCAWPRPVSLSEYTRPHFFRICRVRPTKTEIAISCTPVGFGFKCRPERDSRELNRELP